MKKVCFLSTMHPPLDKRVFEKEATALVQGGFDVSHIAPDETEHITEERNVKVITFLKPIGFADRIGQIFKIYKKAVALKADIYHCNEVDSWLIGLVIKLIHGVKIVFDVHEHYPSTFAQSHFPIWMEGFVKWSIRFLYRLFVPFTDCLVFAKETIKIDFPKKSIKKQVNVLNYTSSTYNNLYSTIDDTTSQKNDDRIDAIHVGIINRRRGWPQILKAMSLSSSKNLHLTIIGDFNDNSDDAFNDRLVELNLQDRVHVFKWMPFSELFKKITRSDIGLVLFQPGYQNYVYALPHKFFDYLTAGLPVIIPDFAVEIRKIVLEGNCGILVDTADPQELARALDQLTTNKQKRRMMGDNGRNLVLQKYNWENEAEKLVRMYQMML